MISILLKNETPNWIHYPDKYIKLINENKDEFLPWYLMDRQQILIRYDGLKKRHPTRSLFPFARDDDSDDVACWEKNKPGMVVIIHDFASPGYESKIEFNSFLDWYEYITDISDN